MAPSMGAIGGNRELPGARCCVVTLSSGAQDSRIVLEGRFSGQRLLRRDYLAFIDRRSKDARRATVCI